jgi:hypothetical protein
MNPIPHRLGTSQILDKIHHTNQQPRRCLTILGKKVGSPGILTARLWIIRETLMTRASWVSITSKTTISTAKSSQITSSLMAVAAKTYSHHSQVWTKRAKRMSLSPSSRVQLIRRPRKILSNQTTPKRSSKETASTISLKASRAQG